MDRLTRVWRWFVGWCGRYESNCTSECVQEAPTSIMDELVVSLVPKAYTPAAFIEADHLLADCTVIHHNRTRTADGVSVFAGNFYDSIMIQPSKESFSHADKASTESHATVPLLPGKLPTLKWTAVSDGSPYEGQWEGSCCGSARGEAARATSKYEGEWVRGTKVEVEGVFVLASNLYDSGTMIQPSSDREKGGKESFNHSDEAVTESLHGHVTVPFCPSSLPTLRWSAVSDGSPYEGQWEGSCCGSAGGEAARVTAQYEGEWVRGTKGEGATVDRGPTRVSGEGREGARGAEEGDQKAEEAKAPTHSRLSPVRASAKREASRRDHRHTSSEFHASAVRSPTPPPRPYIAPRAIMAARGALQQELYLRVVTVDRGPMFAKKGAVMSTQELEYSVSEENIANITAQSIASVIPDAYIYDACTGGAGNAIGFAANGLEVVGSEKNPEHYENAIHNLHHIYGYDHVYIYKDCFLARTDKMEDHIIARGMIKPGKPAFDVVYFDPPWGPGYRAHGNYDITKMGNSGDMSLFDMCALMINLSPSFAIKLPRQTPIADVAKLANHLAHLEGIPCPPPLVEVYAVATGNPSYPHHIKFATVYIGDIAKRLVAGMAHRHLPTTTTKNPSTTIDHHVHHRRLCAGGGRVERLKRCNLSAEEDLSRMI
ncbi:unnamed protein product [Vitrella brassicaformis CCMP3155]|uniref:Trimethylguanosine synthase n=1 Tax=Vitrella brassicaformis (strain CCMP3155) TaxID=1169540 RepID=A0A0G4EIQ3_VITBC|nr:unnamed protein product [Vitrella brassicaformis CCMP3155]|eukprot:CEL96889.1 unnamed protein product [Vitrella brassicaformis CCMP3155]